MKADGTIEKYKARWGVKGYKQKEGLDYFDTYSPFTRITYIRILIAIAAINDIEIHQMDVKTTFLNGDLNEEIYIEQLEEFVAPNQKRKTFCTSIHKAYFLTVCTFGDGITLISRGRGLSVTRKRANCSSVKREREREEEEEEEEEEEKKKKKKV
ncbi:hypothetical protein RJ639_028437 [Escallonia herrerae]|uniref:Reverse transcriptase Ty1/copia-type domain-containing protein n=1 Tax=Escallonia herrerae TaxID=1293975 RepID=A0AA89BKQ4_9ASTE|nr:hypothetical protein RJ639_028437 [Escallonia herrerae]